MYYWKLWCNVLLESVVGAQTNCTYNNCELVLEGDPALKDHEEDEDTRNATAGDDDCILMHDGSGEDNKCMICLTILEATNRSLTVDQMKEFGTCIHAKNVCCCCFLHILHKPCPMCRTPEFCKNKEEAVHAITINTSMYEY